MKYLSFDIEATGLKEDCVIIEFGMIPFDTKTAVLEDNLKYHTFVKCQSFEELKPSLDIWVVEHNEELIKKAHQTGISMEKLKSDLVAYLNKKEVKEYFGPEKVILFGKSMNAIDLPFLNRDLGWDFMRQHFSHRVFDLTSVTYNLIDMGHLPVECESGSCLSEYLGIGEVAHTALEDAQNMAKMYLELIKRFKVGKG